MSCPRSSELRMQREETALNSAMAPALPKLDIPVLKKAIADAKAAGIAEKVVTKAETKLQQALKRQGVIAGAPAREAAEKNLAAKIDAGDIGMEELKWAIEEAEEQSVSKEKVEAAKVKLAQVEQAAAKTKLLEAMELPDNEREKLQAALTEAKDLGVDDEVMKGAERRLSEAWSV